jgi:uncharacterized protein YkwD
LKKRILKKLLIFVLVLLVSAILLPQFLHADTQSGVSAFVTRFYSTCLNRMPDAGGLSSWVNGLQSGRVTGAQVANGFIFSDELLSQNLSDEKFLNIMYSAFFNRQPDSGGFINWMNVMANGASRHYVLAGFVNSLEFNILCDAYGINPGSIASSGSSSFAPSSNTQFSASTIEISLFNSVNSVRSQYGIGPLSLNPSLSNIARSRGMDMINRNYFSHTTPDGKNIFIILNENGFCWQIAGENIYQCLPTGMGSESAILSTWMASPSHRDNLLNGAFNQVGIGIVDSGNTRTVSIIFSN